VNTETTATESVVRSHLQAFLEQQGIAAILYDYHEDAQFFTEAKVHHGKQEIGVFFTDFIGSLPEGSIDRFALTSMHVDGNVAYITWNVGDDILLGTDTFVVDDGRIVSQTFAMYASP
jgi:ketosteroid isomerase-like protein